MAYIQMPCKDLLASRTESCELITWAHGDPALYDKSTDELSVSTTKYSFPTNDIPFGWLDGNWSLQGSSSDSNLTTLPPLANSTAQPGSDRFVRLEDIERNGAAPIFEVENWHVDPQNGSNHMLGLEALRTPASIPNGHESMEEIPYTNTELSAGHAVNDQSAQSPHPGRNILSHRKRRPPQTQTHIARLPIGRSSLRLTTRRSTNAVPGSQIRPTVHQATAPVKKWFDAHRDSPYASNEEKAALASSTGLTSKQISDCLSNLRARKLLKGGYFIFYIFY
jgi:Homeobox KN domain